MTILSCLLTAVISALLFPPFNLAALVPAALVPMLWAMHREASMRRRILAGWLAGCVYWMVVCHWIGAVLDAYGGLSGPLSLLALVLFAAVKALHWAGFAWGAGLLIRRPWAIPGIAALWTGLERTQGPLGFAWLMLGNAGIEMALPLRLAPVFGVYGLSFLFAALATGLTLMALRRPRKELLWLAPFAGLALLPAVEVAQPAAQEAVSMQMNVAGDTRWTPEEKERAARQFSLLSLESALRPGLKTPALMLWPEVPAPFYYYDDPAFRQLVTETARLASTPLLFGTIAYTPERQPLNSAVL
ncbi:MAG: apolipoprotein N-acyltransferase, partial [Bryobacteraceae bacterium]|nr:apolipoprotein N-acyltransferase [Bryobacteraceae bacterium]